jgi:nucleoside diphosphate kinase
MAALAIPIVLLGSIYILSEQEKKEVHTQNNIAAKILANDFFTEGQLTAPEGFTNYNNTNIDNLIAMKNDSINNYNNQNQQTDKFFVANSTNIIREPPRNINLMSGQQTNTSDFKHSNMQPFYGAKIRGSLDDINLTESILDSKQGSGSQINSKAEIAPLFSPYDNVNLPNGTPNNSDFFQSRINESMKMSNVTLWEQQRVGPGLNLGYGSQNSSGLNSGGVEGSHGFNSGMMARESWLPKSVDNLRVDTNPKISYNLDGHQGPAIYPIKMQGPNTKIGVVEKHLPDKSYESGPTRWFTTTGVEQAPPIRSTQVIPMENRISTTREYYGATSNTEAGRASYIKQDFEDSKKQTLSELPIINASASGKNSANPNDYGYNSYNFFNNNRTTDREPPDFGGIYGMAKASFAPILDIFRQTRKEDTIGNLRQTGNVNGLTPTGHLFNINDKTKVTNREMTTNKIDMNFVNVQGQNNNGNAYQVTQHQNYDNQRTTTSTEYIGSGNACGSGLRPYNNAYAQQNNVNKSYESRTNQGSMNLFNNHNNSTTSRNESLLQQNRGHVNNGGPNVTPSVDFIGQMNGMQSYDINFNNSRMDESLLSAFKNNPYTKSLTSVA